jgi:hypothetical protein
MPSALPVKRRGLSYPLIQTPGLKPGAMEISQNIMNITILKKCF